MKTVRGCLIALEGCDRTGKTTQSKMLSDWLQKFGNKVELWRFPDRSTVTGKILDDYLKKQTEIEDHSVHLLFSANRWECVPKMKEVLKNGTTLIVDRYAYSGVAFSAAKKGMGLTWCQHSDVGLPKPDLVIFLDMDLRATLDRAEFGTERYECLDFQYKVRENYLQMKDINWKVFEANKSIEDLHNELRLAVLDAMNNINTELGQLWTDLKN